MQEFLYFLSLCFMDLPWRSCKYGGCQISSAEQPEGCISASFRYNLRCDRRSARPFFPQWATRSPGLLVAAWLVRAIEVAGAAHVAMKLPNACEGHL
jgi:hypothetical protein